MKEMVELIFIILFLFLAVFLSGCINQPTNQTAPYVKDIIVIENYEISDSTIYNGSSATLRFTVKNKGKETVEKVKLTFFNLGGFKNYNLKCYKAEIKDSECIFYNLKSGEDREVKLEVFAPDIVPPSGAGIPVNFFVEYDVSRKAQAVIPIIDKTLLTKPLASFSSTQFGDGPIKFEFKLAEASYGEKAIPFKVEMLLTDIGTYTNKKTPKIPAGNIVLTVYKLSKTSPCPHFDDSYKSTKELFLNPSDSLYCFFKSEDFEGSELDVLIEATYNYTYTFFRTQSFTIKPMG
ncbi:MAG: hypothetical protein QW841_01855 [Candidatus Aenigmatarchaeota archaeon]